MVAGGNKVTEAEFLRKSEEIMKTGVVGMAVGRNVWQHDYPLQLSMALRKIIYDNATAQEAEKFYEQEIHKQK